MHMKKVIKREEKRPAPTADDLKQKAKPVVKTKKEIKKLEYKMTMKERKADLIQRAKYIKLLQPGKLKDQAQDKIVAEAVKIEDGEDSYRAAALLKKAKANEKRSKAAAQAKRVTKSKPANATIKAKAPSPEAPTAGDVYTAHKRMSSEQSKLVKAAIELRRNPPTKKGLLAKSKLDVASKKLDVEAIAVKNFQKVTDKKRGMIAKMMKYTDHRRAKGGGSFKSPNDVNRDKIKRLAKAIQALDKRLKDTSMKTISATTDARAAKKEALKHINRVVNENDPA